MAAMEKAVDFLVDDVHKHGGSAGQTFDVHGTLWEVTVCAVPWGTIILRREVTYLEAVLSLLSAE